MTRIGSLFSGYGGLDMAAQAVFGGEVVWYSEIEPAACKVLAAHNPGVPNLGDITAVDWATVAPVDILTGGYPCQPFSHAGQRKGTDDVRHLWPYVRDAIAALRPMVTVLENVDGHRSLGLADVLGDIADLGLAARWGVVRAADAGAPHGRKRVFIVVADADSAGLQGHLSAGGSSSPRRQGHPVAGTGRPAADAGRGPLAGTAATGNGLPVAAQRGDAAADAEGGRGLPLWPLRTGETWAAARVSGNGQRPTADADGAGSEARARRPRTGDTGRREPMDSDPTVDWGKYGPAIRRWEHVLGRPAPAPTVTGTNGQQRLSPAFVEWMMGLPQGHVTGHGLSNAQALRMLGNGVVPSQAVLALRMLLAIDAQAVAA